MKVRIISLGEIVVPNLGIGIMELAKIFAEKKTRLTGIPAEIPVMAKLVQTTLEANMKLIDQFKLGADEAALDNSMVDAFETDIGVRITTEEFHACWMKMNPKFAAFKNALQAAIDFNSQPNQKLIFISFTNVKDLRHLTTELKENGIPFKEDANGLCEIAGIKLYATCFEKMTKSELIKKAKAQAIAKPEQPHDGLSLFAEEKSEKVDTKFIYGTNKIDRFEGFCKEFDRITSETVQVAEELFIDTVLWDKNKMQSLAEILGDDKLVARPVLIASL